MFSAPLLTKHIDIADDYFETSSQLDTKFRVLNQSGVEIGDDLLVLVDAFRLDIVTLDLMDVLASCYAGRVALCGSSFCSS